MMRSWMRIAARFPAWCAGWLSGLCVGLWFATMFIAWTLSVGTTLPVVTAAVLVGAACLIAGCTQSHRLRSLGPWTNATFAICFAGWIVLSRDLPEWATWCYSWWPLSALSSEIVTIVATIPVALLVIGPPLFALGAWLHGDDPVRPDLRVKRLLGLGLGLILAPQTALLWFGVTATVMCLAGICLLRVVYELTHFTNVGQRLHSATAAWWAARCSVNSTATPNHVIRQKADAPVQSDSGSNHKWDWSSLTIACLAGAGLAVVQRVWSQLFMSQIHWGLVLLGCLCIGIACGSAIAKFRIAADRKSPFRSHEPLFVAACIALVLFGYSWWIGGMLRLNTYCETPWITLAVRTGVVAAMALPLALLIGVASPAPSSQRRAGNPEWLCAATGYLTARWLSASPDTAGLVIVLGLISCGLALALLHEQRTWRHLAKWWTAPVGLAVAMALLSSYSSAHSTRLLFSTQVFLAARAGEPADLLPQLDATRLISTVEGRESTWTVWSQQGYRISIRRDGMPHGAFSRDLSICPHSASEIVPAILPLVLHHEPRSVMLLGTVTPASLSACTAFPLERIRCVSRDADALELLNELAEQLPQKNSFHDDRVDCLPLDPVLAMRAANDELQDVIICRVENSAAPGEGGTFTVEFYRHVARHLDASGVFAQQVDLADFGAQPLQRMLASLRVAFPSVVFVHTSPDKGLLLASPTERAWLDESLARRAEAPHVRRLCSQVGWDWSVLLSLTSTSPEGVQNVAAGAFPLSSGDGAFLCSFPVEVLRWGPKSHELYMALVPHSSALITWLGSESTIVDDVSHRLSDMTLQRKVIQDHPDFYWAYRQQLKERLQAPHHAVVQASGGGLENGMHPDDRRRVDYLRALGEAATQPEPAHEDVAALCEFLEPYDPMMSFFIHQEIAHLYARSSTPNPREELQHLLHSVFYGPGHDLSVRNVVDSLELVLAHPELIADPQERFDCLNGLLELLKYRWQLRMQSVNAISKFGPVDASLSLQAAEQALDEMDDLQPHTTLSDADWLARRRVLDRHFINNVETYRDRISRHVGRFASAPSHAPTDDLDEFESTDDVETTDALSEQPTETAAGPQPDSPLGPQEETVQ